MNQTRPARRLVLSSMAVAAIVATLAGLAGCGDTIKVAGTRSASFGSSSPDRSPSSVPASSASASSPAAAASSASSAGPTSAADAALGAELAAAALKPTDFNTPTVVKLFDKGDQLAGQVTLDNCGFTFTSETHRVARREYEIDSSTGQGTGIGNELVAYDSPASATLALNEWKQSVSTCPKTPVKSTVPGVPDLTMVVKTNSTNATLPIPTNVVTLETGTSKDDEANSVPATWFFAVIQVHGRFLDAVWFSGPIDPTGPLTDGLVKFAASTGARVAQL
jgi:hypothetical protein